MTLFWTTNPIIFELGPFALRWYGLFFALAFVIGTAILRRMYQIEGKPVEETDTLLTYGVLAVVVGARLGHVLFYEPAYYLSNPLEIFAVWHGGLASHGGGIGSLLVLYWFAKKFNHSFLWICDRIAVLVPMTGALIRTGNFFNSEIIGKATDGTWGVIFARIDGTPRHPAQLYEAACYLLIFGCLLLWYGAAKSKDFQGRLLGLMLVGVFTARFGIEMIKENQVAFESAMAFNMGQLLSIPFVLLGAWLLLRKTKQ